MALLDELKKRLKQSNLGQGAMAVKDLVSTGKIAPDPLKEQKPVQMYKFHQDQPPEFNFSQDPKTGTTFAPPSRNELTPGKPPPSPQPMVNTMPAITPKPQKEPMVLDALRGRNEAQAATQPRGRLDGNVQAQAEPSQGGNLPQRNQNPGNLKIGGIGDQLAKKGPSGEPMTDEQGHLVFESPEAGFQAMKEDVRAKITGGSRHLPANPTLAQLGSVYAEDPNWPNQVALMLGVSPETKTQEIDLDQLIQAIARQEGFFAQ